MALRLLAIQPKDIHVTVEISLADLMKVRDAISLANIAYDGKKVEEKEAVFFLTKEFFPFINEIVTKYGGENDGS